MSMTIPHARFLLLVGLCVMLLSVCGCDGSSDSNDESTSSTPDPKANYVDQSITQHHHLGWLGARSNPVSESIWISDPDSSDGNEETVSPGGIVIRQVTEKHPAAESGLKVGDVIVRVGETWLPIKDDPTLNFMTEIENLISGGSEKIALGILRNGSFSVVDIEHRLESLDKGMPRKVARLDDAAMVALQDLARQQASDGSFGDAGLSASDRMKVTATVGLAMLAIGDEQFKSNIDACTTYLGATIDKHASPRNAESGKLKSKPTGQVNDPTIDQSNGLNAVSVAVPELDIDPLTAACVMQYLAESEVQMMDADWMPRILGMVGKLARSQSESGGWAVAEPVFDEQSQDAPTSDVRGTHTTNQVLMALGAWESKGLAGKPDLISKACDFLQSQYRLRTNEARSSSGMDRRTRAVLTAGTAAALVAINCEPSDPIFRQITAESLDRAIDVTTSPDLGASGLICTSIVARSGDKRDWSRFVHAIRIQLLARISPNGECQSISVSSSPDAKPGLVAQNDSSMQTASVALALAMQNGNLERLTGTAASPMQIVRNSVGQKTDGASAQAKTGMPDLPAGATNVMTLDLKDLSGEGSIEDQIKEKMKEMGLDTDNVEFGKIGGPPKSKEKKK